MRQAVTLELILGLALSVAGTIYLTYAMLRPEKF
jgi:K+-transporting ATPase KdpF subunit